MKIKLKLNTILFLIIVLLSLITLYDYTYYNKSILNNTTNVNTSSKVKLIIFNDNKIEEKIIEIKTNTLDEGEYIKETLNNIPFLNDKFKFLASYEYDNNILIKLNSEFKKLSNSNLNDVVNSIKSTIRENFKNIQNITIEIDSN